ncbi:MAG: hypothetical protein KF874_11355 [Rhizobiaceae bacterium]|nr:hypothetical protein [Rhizobiaceae bacterium]
MASTRRLLFALMVTFNLALTASLGYLFIARGFVIGAIFTSVELVTIVLAALALILTALGLFIAILAIWGYQSLQSGARETAERIARETADKVASRTAADAVSRLSDGATSYGSDYVDAATKGDSNDD